MYKIVFALAILSGSAISYGQYDSSMENKVQTKMEDTSVSEMKMQKWSAGLLSGVNSPTGDLGSSPEFGVTIGIQPTNNFSAGIEGNTTRLNNSNDVKQANVLFKSAYVIGGDVPVIRNTYFGVGAGPVFVSNRVRWAGAPLVGFDVPLSNSKHDVLSLGLEAKYLFITNTDVPDLFASALALKYWF